MVALNALNDNSGSRQKRHRVGRGIGSGTGKTAGRGHKGQKARTGVSIKAFEGGQQPLYRRLPKRGFVNHTREVNLGVNIAQILRLITSKKLDAKNAITSQQIKDALNDNTSRPVKLLANGDIKEAINLKIEKASAGAKAKIEKAKGSVEITA